MGLFGSSKKAQRELYQSNMMSAIQSGDLNTVQRAMNYEPPKKDASVVGRAVVGGVVAGPAGAVVGALSAVDKNRKK